MRRLDEIRSEMLEKEILTPAQTCKMKGGQSDDEKRRPRPGGGVGTHSGTVPTC